jgi:hypothetical protein
MMPNLTTAYSSIIAGMAARVLISTGIPNVKGYDDTIYPVDFNRSGQINSDVHQQYSILNIGNAFNYGKPIADWLSFNGSL